MPGSAPPPLNENTEDTRAFLRWAQAFRRRCQSDGYLAQADLEETLLHAVESGRPLRQLRWRRPRAAAGRLRHHDPGADRAARRPARRRRHDPLLDPGAPRHACICTPPRIPRPSCTPPPAGSASSCKRHAPPTPRIAVILPSVDAERAAIDRVFREVLAPELLPITAGTSALPYEFSLGQPLARVPMIATALDLLRWSRRPLPLETVSRLLLSPFFTADEDERGARAEFDAFELRRSTLLRPELSLDALIALAEDSRRRAPRLGGLLRQLRSLRRTAANICSPASPSAPTPSGPTPSASCCTPPTGRPPHAARTASPSRPAASGRARSTSSPPSTSRASGPPSPRRSTRSARCSTTRSSRPSRARRRCRSWDRSRPAAPRFDAVWFLRAGDLDWPTPLLHQSPARLAAAARARHARRRRRRRSRARPPHHPAHRRQRPDRHLQLRARDRRQPAAPLHAALRSRLRRRLRPARPRAATKPPSNPSSSSKPSPTTPASRSRIRSSAAAPACSSRRPPAASAPSPSAASGPPSSRPPSPAWTRASAATSSTSPCSASGTRSAPRPRSRPCPPKTAPPPSTAPSPRRSPRPSPPRPPRGRPPTSTPSANACAACSHPGSNRSSPARCPSPSSCARRRWRSPSARCA